MHIDPQQRVDYPSTMPKRCPTPTATSPQVTRNENSPALGSTKFCKNDAYHPCTAGCAPVVWAKAPATKPLRAFPLAPQAGEITLSHPASSHSAPTYMRTTNHIPAEPAEARKNFAIAGSGNCSVEAAATKACRSWEYCTNARISARRNRMGKATPQ